MQFTQHNRDVDMKSLQKLPLQRFFTLFLFVIASIISFSSCESRKTIVNGLDEKEANEILVFLAGKNIDAAKVVSKEGAGAGGGSKITLWDIAVDSSKATEAMAVLNANGLPRRRGQNLLDLFSAGGLVPSEMQEKIRYQAGLAEQIASTIRKIDGILECDVQLSFPEEDPLNPQAQKGKATASVYVKHQGVLDDPNSHLTTKIKRLVASSVNGLDFDNVTVIGDRARFSDVSIEGGKSRGPSEKMEYTRVWSIVLAKDSLLRFQIIFFSFSLIILVFLLMILWMAWKLYPVLKNHGGVSLLFKLAPLEPVFKQPAAPTTEAETAAAPATVAAQENKAPKVQENVESP